MQKDTIKNHSKNTIKDALALFFLFISSLVISLPLLNDFPINTDEGIILHGAVRLLNGEVPYRDFWHITLPGAIWLYALVFKIAGDKFIVARLTGYLFIAGQSILIYLIGKRITKHLVISLCASVIFFLNISIVEVNCEPHITSVFFALLALFLYLTGTSWRMRVMTGIVIALSTMAQQNIGAAGFAALLLLLMIDNLNDGFYLKKYLKGALLISSGLLVVFIPFILYLMLTHSLSPAIYVLFQWPFSNYVGFNKYPYLYSELTSIKNWIIKNGVSFHLLIDITPLIIVGFLPIIVIPYLFYAGIKEKNHTLLSVICYTIMIQVSVIFLRPDYFHLLFVSPLYFLLLFYSIHFFWLQAKNSKMKLLSGTLLLLLTLPLIFSFIRWTLFYKSRALSRELPVDTERGRVSITYHTPPWMYDVIRYIESSTEKNELIFVYHWSPVIYFLTGRKNPTPFDTYKPIYNTDKQMQKIIESLKLYRPRLIVKDWYIDPSPGHPNRNMFPNVDWGTLLDMDPVNKFILENYVFQGSIGSFKIFTLPE